MNVKSAKKLIREENKKKKDKYGSEDIMVKAGRRKNESENLRRRSFEETFTRVWWMNIGTRPRITATDEDASF